MKVNEIIKTLKHAKNKFPTEAIIEARKNKEEITKLLLQDLENIIENPDIIFDEELYDFSFYLLAEFKEKQAFSLIIKILEQFDEEDLYYMLGDIITENLGAILASTFDGNILLLTQIIENKTNDEYLRAATLDALAILYNKNLVNRKFFIQYLNKILEQYKNDNDFLLCEIASITCDLKLYELVPQIEQLFIEDKFDDFFMSLNDFREFMDEPALEEYEYIDDCKNAMSWMYRSIKNYTKKTSKIGRNDPCPCGSGKKYKKCCGK